LVLSLAYLGVRSGVSPMSDGRAAARRKGGNRLEEELRQAQDQIRRTRHLTALSDTLDLDQLLARVLQAATALADADAGAVTLRQEGEPPVVKSMNLPAEDAL